MSHDDPHAEAPLRTLLRRNGRAMLAAAGLTLLVQVGLFGAVAGLGADRATGGRALEQPTAVAMVLLGSLVWLVVAAPAFAAGGRSTLDGLVRAGTVIDSTAVVLGLTAWAAEAVTAWSAVRLYLLFAAIALAASGVARQGRRASSRHVLAAVAIVAAVAVAAGPFWANGLILAAEGPWRTRAVRLVTAANGVCATAACLPAGGGFVWNERPVLYEHTVLGRDVPAAPAPWYVTAGAAGVVGAGLFAIAGARSRRLQRA